MSVQWYGNVIHSRYYSQIGHHLAILSPCHIITMKQKDDKVLPSHYPIPKFSKPLTSMTFTLRHIFYCVARTWVAIGCQRDLLLLGRLLRLNLCHTRCKLRLSRDALVKGLENLIIVSQQHHCTCYILGLSMQKALLCLHIVLL